MSLEPHRRRQELTGSRCSHPSSAIVVVLPLPAVQLVQQRLGELGRGVGVASRSRTREISNHAFNGSAGIHVAWTKGQQINLSQSPCLVSCQSHPCRCRTTTRDGSRVNMAPIKRVALLAVLFAVAVVESSAGRNKKKREEAPETRRGPDAPPSEPIDPEEGLRLFCKASRKGGVLKKVSATLYCTVIVPAWPLAASHRPPTTNPRPLATGHWPCH